MSSWLARSLANSLGIDEEEDESINSFVPIDDNNICNTDNRNNTGISFSKFDQQRHNPNEERDGDADEPDSPARRVQDDLSEFKETLTRQLWGVANFLVPPPQTTTSSTSHSEDRRDHRFESQVYYHHQLDSSDLSVSGFQEAESPVLGQNRSRFETGGRNSGSEFSPSSKDNGRLVLNNLRLAGIYDRLGPLNEDDGKEEEEEDVDWISQAVGVTDEVLAFAGNIAHHPETWLDFPIEEDEDLEDFSMSESQKLHALAVERLTPRLAALRFELCPAHMSEGYFWKVYFVLLHSRLNKCDAELLSTPQVMDARTKWMKELQKRAKEELERQHGSFKHYKDVDDSPHEGFTPTYPHFELSESMPLWTSISECASSSTTAESENEKHPSVGTDLQFIDKPFVEEMPMSVAPNVSMLAGLSSTVGVPNFDDDDDDWPEDDLENGKSLPVIHVGIDEDISFSDLEDDDCILPSKSKVDPNDKLISCFSR